MAAFLLTATPAAAGDALYTVHNFTWDFEAPCDLLYPSGDRLTADGWVMVDRRIDYRGHIIEDWEDPTHGQWAVAIVTFKGRGSDDVMRCILASGGNER